MIDNMKIIEIEKEDYKKWADLWVDYWNEEVLLRDHSESYYKKNYCNNNFNKAYIGKTATQRGIVYCGIKTKYINSPIKTYKIAEISDLIIDKDYRQNGYYKQFLTSLFDNYLKDYDEICFFPINKEAYYALKINFKTKKNYEINNWCVWNDPNNLCSRIDEISIVTVFEIPDKLEDLLSKSQNNFLTYKRDIEYLNHKYINSDTKYIVNIINYFNKIIGFFIYKEIKNEGLLGGEIADIYFNTENISLSLDKIFESILINLKQNNIEFFTFKTVQNNSFDVFLKNSNLNTYHTKHSVVSIITNTTKESLNVNALNWDNHIFDGEDWDIPRCFEFILSKINKNKGVLHAN